MVARRENLLSQKDDNYQVVRGISRPDLPEVQNADVSRIPFQVKSYFVCWKSLLGLYLLDKNEHFF